MRRNPKDFWTGLIYIFFGSSAIFIARDYAMGNAFRMGPAYFPTVLSIILILIGATSLIRSFITPGTPIGLLRLRGFRSLPCRLSFSALSCAVRVWPSRCPCL